MGIFKEKNIEKLNYLEKTNYAIIKQKFFCNIKKKQYLQGKKETYALP